MKRSAQLLIILAATCWGMLGIFTRQLTAVGFSFVEITLSRSMITAVFLFAFLIITDREKIKIMKKDIWIFLCMGAFGIVFNNICYFNTIELITLSAASILIYTAPYMVMIMSALIFKERITWQKVSALMIAFSGCVMTIGITDHDTISIIGILSGLGSAFGYSLYSIFGRIALQRYHPLTITAYTFAVAGFALIPFSNIGKMFTILAEDSTGLRNILILGICLTIVPFVCYTKGLKDIEPSKASIIAFVEPLTASISGIIVFGEMLSLLKILGIILIFLSLAILNVNSNAMLKRWVKPFTNFYKARLSPNGNQEGLKVNTYHVSTGNNSLTEAEKLERIKSYNLKELLLIIRAIE